MTVSLRKFDDDMIVIQVSGIYEATKQKEVIDPNTARDIANDLLNLADEQEKRQRASR